MKEWLEWRIAWQGRWLVNRMAFFRKYGYDADRTELRAYEREWYERELKRFK